jgi:oxygen-independent coproporphyrinogen-3 oxidase
VGVQDFDPAVQKRINRRQSFEETREIIAESRQRGFVSVNVDLMYGLPLQTVDRFQRTLDRIEEIRPDRIALFGYAHVPSMKKHQGLFQPEELPGPAERLALLETSIRRLRAAGYVHLGLDHFALEGDELYRARTAGTLRRNFMGYTTCADSDVLAFGPSAISEVSGTYMQNAREVHRWTALLEGGHLPAVRGHHPSAEDRARSALITQLFCDLEVDLDALRARFPAALQDLHQEEHDLVALERDGLVVRDGARLRVTLRGQLLLRTVAAPFDTYHRADARRHARPMKTAKVLIVYATRDGQTRRSLVASPIFSVPGTCCRDGRRALRPDWTSAFSAVFVGSPVRSGGLPAVHRPASRASIARPSSASPRHSSRGTRRGEQDPRRPSQTGRTGEGSYGEPAGTLVGWSSSPAPPTPDTTFWFAS